MKMASLRSRFKLCTFDVTNTLLKFKIPVGEQYVKVGRIYGVDREPSQITSAFMRHWKEMNSRYPNFGCSKGLSSKEWWRKLVEKTFFVDDDRITDKELDCISNHLYDIYKYDVCWELVPGALPLLKLLREKEITTGVISNFDERLESVLCAYNLHSYFNFVLASYIVQVAKPERKIFDLALNCSPGIKPTDALHVGDNFKLDYLAAKNAGWNAVLVYDKAKNEHLSEDINIMEVVEDISKLESHIFCL